MDRQRWQRIEQVFHAALELNPEHRDAFLAEACLDDADLLREVARLIAQNSRSLRLSFQTIQEQTVESAAPTDTLLAGVKLGPYQVLGSLGEGGMGRVYRALDTRLGRSVAIKTSDMRFNQRFEREARSVSALNHPNICTLYDIGSLPSGATYMVSELVEGETLRDWLTRSEQGSDTGRAIEIARQVLEALRAAHAAGIVHRDLKPANIMVRFDGYVKVLDFGLAKRVQVANRPAGEETATLSLDRPGQIVGTVAYMSPEQIDGGEIDARSDLFSFGIVLYEMIAGRHPWPGRSTLEIFFAILHDDPPPVAHALDGVLQKLLRKNREDRYASAEEVLAAIAIPPPPPPVPLPRPLTRLIVLPFRILRRHEETDFLAASLPDAITSSLAAIDSLVVRPTVAASRFSVSAEIDVRTVASEAHVDAILTGTILSDSRRLRLNAQLIGASNGSLLWSDSFDVSIGDTFQLHDELVNRIVQSLQLPLTAGERRALKYDVPANPMSYHFYLSANHLAAGYEPRNLIEARNLYLRSLEADSKYAPAWAALGRTYRLIGKYAGNLNDNFALAEQSFQKAFELNPDLALAHNYFTSLQTDRGQPIQAMERLLKRAREHRHDPQLLVGLVLACRYSGLAKASVAAHDAVRRLDPNLRTSVAYSFFQLGEYQRVLDTNDCSDPYGTAGALAALGREDEAIAGYIEFEKTAPTEHMRLAAVFNRAFLEGDTRRGLDALDQLFKTPGPFVHDPESHYWVARILARANQAERALSSLTRAFTSGYYCHFALLHDPWLQRLRHQPGFAELVRSAAAKDQEARHVFLANEGGPLLGVPIP